MTDEHPDIPLMIQAVVEAERCGRWVTAAMGLARLHEHHEAGDAPTETWEAYAAREIPLPPERVHELLGKMLHGRRCPRCGAYPHARVFAAEAVLPPLSSRTQRLREQIAAALKRTPSASDRAIAKQIRCDHKTVGKVRKALKASPQIPHEATA